MKQYAIGIDVGGTNMKAVLFNGEKVIMDYSLATPKDSVDHMLVMIIALIEPLQARAKTDNVDIKGVGLSVAGVHDFDNNKIAKSPNIPVLDGVKLGELLSKRVDLSVKMDNDANCFVRAEATIGAVKKLNNVYGITVGTGIGGGWWLNKKIYKGSHGGGGEPGSMIIDFSDLVGLEQAYQKLNQHNATNLAKEAYRGDILAQKAFEETGRILGVALANIVNIIDPEAVVIGGGTVNASDLFFPEIKKEMIKYILSPISKKIKIYKTKFGNDAGAIGAALLIK